MLNLKAVAARFTGVRSGCGVLKVSASALTRQEFVGLHARYDSANVTCITPTKIASPCASPPLC